MGKNSPHSAHHLLHIPVLGCCRDALPAKGAGLEVDYGHYVLPAVQVQVEDYWEAKRKLPK